MDQNEHIPETVILPESQVTTTESALDETSSNNISRRKSLKYITSGLITAALGYVYTTSIEPYWLDVTHRKLTFPQLPSKFQNKLGVQISDTHIGSKVSMDYLQKVIKLVNDLQPDIIFITGDIIHFNSMKFLELAVDLFKKLNHPELGIYAVLGNHDYGMSWYELDRDNVLSRELRKLGMTVLRNEFIIKEGVQFAGVDDYWGPIFHPEKVLPQLNPELPSIVLSHNPDTCDLPFWDNVNGWVLSGHTHGGQVKIPFFRPPYLPVKNKRYSQGEFTLRENLHLYINRGTGFTYPLRFNVRPELTCFTLEQS